MTPNDLIADLRSRINPAYAATLGTESYERRLCAEALESLIAELDSLRAAAEKSALVTRRAFVCFAQNGNIRFWSQDCERAQKFSAETGAPLVPLYELHNV